MGETASTLAGIKAIAPKDTVFFTDHMLAVKIDKKINNPVPFKKSLKKQ